LVLDNCEHVINAAAGMAEQLMRAGPKVFVLCTSREPLRVEGEWVYQVQPLDVPKEDALTLEDVLQTGAAKLFVSMKSGGAEVTVVTASAILLLSTCGKLRPWRCCQRGESGDRG
jgi:predicted ATPase